MFAVKRDDADAVAAVLEQLRLARQTYPKQLTIYERMTVLTEEVGEVARAILDNEGANRIAEEAAQVAAVAIRIMTEHAE